MILGFRQPGFGSAQGSNSPLQKPTSRSASLACWLQYQFDPFAFGALQDEVTDLSLRQSLPEEKLMIQNGTELTCLSGASWIARCPSESSLSNSVPAFSNSIAASPCPSAIATAVSVPVYSRAAFPGRETRLWSSVELPIAYHDGVPSVPTHPSHSMDCCVLSTT